MKDQKIKTRFLYIILTITILTILVFVCYVSTQTVPEQKQISITENIQIESGWEMQTISDEWVPISFSYKTPLPVHSNIKIRYHLPENMTNGKALCLQSQNAAISAFIEGKQIFNFGTTKNTSPIHFFGTDRIAIDLPDNAQGQYITLSLSGERFSYISNPSLTTQDAFIAQAIVQFIPQLFICIILILLGLISIIQNKNKASIFYALFVTTVSTWIFTDNSAIRLLFHNRAVIFSISIFSLFLSIPLYIIFVKEYFQTNKKILSALCIISCITPILSILFVCMGITDLFQMIILAHIELITSIIIIFTISIKRRREQRYKNTIYAIVTLAGFLLLALFMFYFTTNLGIDRVWYSIFTLIGLTCSCVIMYIGVFKNNIALQRQLEQKAGYYKNLAFSDRLTKLGNYASYQNTLDYFDTTQTPLIVIMFDLNNLKIINDTKGHSAGDTLIQNTAQCLQKAFSQKAYIFRIGGDEFIVILTANEYPDKVAEHEIQQFNQIISYYNRTAEFPIDIAYGYAIKSTGQKTQCIDIVYEAEKKMYQMKKTMKA